MERCIGRGGAQNWPPQSPDLNLLNYQMRGHTKAVVYAHKLNTREEQKQLVLSGARSINNAEVLCKVTNSKVTRVRKCIQTGRGHFEQFA